MKVLLISHGDFAAALKSTVEMIIGPQEDAYAFGVYPEADLGNLEQEICEKLDHAAAAGEEILVLTDLFFGTPFNMTVGLMNRYEMLHITGINLPLLLEIMTSIQGASLEKISQIVDEAGADAIKNVTRLLEACDSE